MVQEAWLVIHPSRPLTSEQVEADLKFDDELPWIEIEFAESAIYEWTGELEFFTERFNWLNKYTVCLWNGEFTGEAAKGAIAWIEETKTECRLASQNVTYWRNRLQNLLTKSPNGQPNPNTQQEWRQ